MLLRSDSRSGSAAHGSSQASLDSRAGLRTQVAGQLKPGALSLSHFPISKQWMLSANAAYASMALCAASYWRIGSRLCCQRTLQLDEEYERLIVTGNSYLRGWDRLTSRKQSASSPASLALPLLVILLFCLYFKL